MKIRRISIYEEFQCVGGKCPASCCKGWKIPVDDEVREKYQRKKGMSRLLLLGSIRKKEDISTFRNVFWKCPHWGKDGLCNLQKKHGEEYMPQICRQFPRKLHNLGFFCEETLCLTCPEAVRLFLEQVRGREQFAFEETEGKVGYGVDTTNDDEVFLRYLLTAREQLIEMIDEGCGFDSLAILKYGQEAQAACLRGENCPSPLAYRNLTDAGMQMDCGSLNALFFNGFYHPCLLTRSPMLHRLCVKYMELAVLNKINQKAANQKLRALKENLCRKMPEAELFFNRYYEYYLQSEFLDIFENYSFSKCLLYGMAKTHVLWVLLALYVQGREQLTKEEIAKIVTVFERRAPKIKEGLAAFARESGF